MSTVKDQEMVDKNLDLIFEFEKYVLEHPEFAEDIPNGAIVSMQLEGDEEFNKWSHRLAEEQAEQGQPIVYVMIKKMKPVRSRIEELELEQVT